MSLLNQENYVKNIVEVQSYTVNLEPDPVSMGLVTFHRKISEVVAYYERVSSLMLEAIGNEAEYEIRQAAATREYENALQKVLRENKDVSEQKSQPQRLAYATVYIELEGQALAQADADLLRAKAYRKQLQTKLDSLESIYNGLNDQLGNIRMQLRIGELNHSDWDRFVNPVEPGMKKLYLGKE